MIIPKTQTYTGCLKTTRKMCGCLKTEKLMKYIREALLRPGRGVDQSWQISEVVECSEVVEAGTKSKIREFVSNGSLDVNLLSEVIGELYKEYMKIRSNLII